MDIFSQYFGFDFLSYLGWQAYLEFYFLECLRNDFEPPDPDGGLTAAAPLGAAAFLFRNTAGTDACRRFIGLLFSARQVSFS